MYRLSAIRRGWTAWIVPSVFALILVVLLAYSTLVVHYHNAQNRSAAARYSAAMGQTDPAERENLLVRVRSYNQTLDGSGISDPFAEVSEKDAEPTNGEYVDYAGQLSNSEILARVRVPAAGIDLPVRRDCGGRPGANGAVHVLGSSLPVGGTSTHTIIAGATGRSDATLFDHLDKVEEEDVILVEVAGQTLTYRVDQVRTVLPKKVPDLTITEGKDYVTLMTTTPRATNSHRLLVRGSRVPMNEVDEARLQDG
ncbi:class C sortase [Actinobaculum sp. 313]|uniref:class C sortase n=1 Tax=Actinobaculum sp. 313 TaxID=2495645 RepID=UPI0013DD9A7F|nr:class C sortase [Actinobaculum sp. 313]